MIRMRSVNADKVKTVFGCVIFRCGAIVAFNGEIRNLNTVIPALLDNVLHVTDGVIFNRLNAGGNYETLECRAIIESVVLNYFYGCRNRNLRKRGTTIKGTVFDPFKVIGKADFRERGATVKRAFADVSYRIRNVYLLKSRTIREGIVADFVNSVRDNNAVQ